MRTVTISFSFEVEEKGGTFLPQFSCNDCQVGAPTIYYVPGQHEDGTDAPELDMMFCSHCRGEVDGKITRNGDLLPDTGDLYG